MIEIIRVDTFLLAMVVIVLLQQIDFEPRQKNKVEDMVFIQVRIAICIAFTINHTIKAKVKIVT